MGDFSTGALANRAMSSFPVSIGTSLAMESLFQPMQQAYDPERVLPPKLDIGDYKVFWVNLLTLFRNLMGSLDADGQRKVMAADLSDTLEFEVDLISRLVEEESMGRCATVFYVSDYADLKKAHKHAIVREHKTDKQRQYHAIMEITLRDFFKKQVKSEKFQHFTRLIDPKEKKKTLILTHYAYDLLAAPKFETLDLLESHTGVKKGPASWHTKLNGKDLARMPFNSLTLQVFGDSQTFSPQPIKARQNLIDLAEEYQWQPLITRDRIRTCLGFMKDVYTAQIFKEMLAE